ncbi:MAG: GDSL-type esterase/lipase family protein [Candidatus Hodarchaeales archaeon]|jgi:lysophospholipase L1-like esterase
MKKIIIIMLLLTACGNTGNNGRPAEDGERVFYGDSITHICQGYTDGLNRAVSGMTSDGVFKLTRHFKYTDGDADYTILIGVNDIFAGISEHYIYRMGRIIENIDGRDLVIISILPTRFGYMNAEIIELNNQLKGLGVTVRDVYNDFTDDDGLLKIEYTNDGLHLNDKGCELLYG